VQGGSLSVEGCTFGAEGVRTGSFISTRGGSLAVSGSQLVGPPGAVDFACLDLTDTVSATLKGITVFPGSGQKVAGVRVLRSTCSIGSSTLQSGAGSMDSIAVEARDSDVTLDDVDVTATGRARSPLAISSIGSTVLVTASRIILAGTASAVGINARGGELAVSRSTIRSQAIPEYCALITAEDCRGIVSNCILVGGDAAQSICVLLKGGSIDIVNDTIVAGTGSTITAGILAYGDRLPRIVNTIMVRYGEDRGSAITLYDNGTAQAARPASVVLTSSFSGWQRLLHVEYTYKTDVLDCLTVQQLDAADGDASAGGINGNIQEGPSATFRSPSSTDYRLLRSSACVNAGTDLSLPQGPVGTGPLSSVGGIDPGKDFNGRPRPGNEQLDVPGPPRGWDIGAYQYSR
jgi:hypothetical protein